MHENSKPKTYHEQAAPVHVERPDRADCVRRRVDFLGRRFAMTKEVAEVVTELAFGRNAEVAR